MILDAIISLVTGLLGAAFDLLPTSSLPFFDGFLSAPGNPGVGNDIGQWLGQWNYFVPIIFMLGTLGTVLNILLPGVLAYKTANWVYKHIPQIGGFGPGSG
jgi:hypothetical protein